MSSSELIAISDKLRQLDGSLIQKLFTMEAYMLGQSEQLDIPRTHYFAKGIYAREVTLPKGGILVGLMHRFSQINIISMGEVSVLDELGVWMRMKAPHTFESKAGAKRAVYVHETCLWTTMIATEETDIDKMDELLTIGSYPEYIKEQEKLMIKEKLSWHM